jgi:site-specific DNA recombinase
LKVVLNKRVRCAIYTRVSTDQGLDQDFNSLDAQYDASQAYIRSQAHAGWTLLRGKYDDGGFSGGNTDRPALQQLLQDVTDGKVDVIVVYKVDRLTRSLADFAKLVELFDKHNVSFVSVTQQFNTTTSMGRLTLNVLLSFAQFEREVTSERIRDKIAASKRKGLWVGGMVPLGYDTKDRKISVNESEAELVRTIFRRYLKLGSMNVLVADLRKSGLVTKIRNLKTGGTVGGIPFGRGMLAHILRNRFYVGEVVFKGEVLAGEQPAIVDRTLFDAVQAKLTEQLNNHTTARAKSDALLVGRIFDDRGNRMSPSHARKRGIKYRYYLTSALLEGRPDHSGSIRRVPAVEIEALVIRSVQEHLKLEQPIDDKDVISTHVERIEVQTDQLVIQLSQAETTNRPKKESNNLIHIPWLKTPSTRRREILLSGPTPPKDPRPIRSETRATLVASIARGRRWLDELTTDSIANVEGIAKREGCSARKVNMTISLAFLAPDLVKAAI